MAHTKCINGHTMWDGDGKPSVEAYRIGFFRELLDRDPDCIINHDDFYGKYPYIYDCADGIPGEELDIWYCDECSSFLVFIDGEKERLDYIPCDIESVDNDLNYKEWEEYIAFREASETFEMFHDFCDGKSPLEALLTFGFKDRYFLSPDKRVIVRIENEKGITAIFKLARHIVFDK